MRAWYLPILATIPIAHRTRLLPGSTATAAYDISGAIAIIAGLFYLAAAIACVAFFAIDLSATTAIGAPHVYGTASLTYATALGAFTVTSHTRHISGASALDAVFPLVDTSRAVAVTAGH